MRIITGKARGTLLYSSEGLNTRPTADRTKEGMFNSIQFEIEGKKVLDLFGGSGQLALEALSRGAVSAVICDNVEDACKIIKKNADKTHFSEYVTLLQCDFKTAIKRLSGQKFDIVFLDPPYNSDLLSISLFRVFEAGLVSDGGYVICESSNTEPYKANGASVYKHTKYGKAYVTILKKDAEE